MAMWCAVLLLVFSISSALGDRNGVPVLIWGNRVEHLPPAYAGHTTSMTEFNEKYVKEMVKPTYNVVTFLQDKLSVEDFTQLGDVYQEDSTGGIMQNLKSLVETHPSVHLPSVSKASDALNDLEETFGGKTHQLASPYNLAELSINGPSGNMIVVQLPSTAGSATEQLEAFRKIDEIIGSVVGYLKKQSLPFLAFYTAKRPSMMVMEEDNYLGRHLLATADESNATIVNTTCVLMYLEQLSLVLTPSSSGDDKPKSTTFPLPQLDSSAITVDCGKSLGTVTMPYGKSGDLTSLELKLMLKSEKGFWKVSGSSLKYTVTINKESYPGDMKMNFNIFAPNKYSFHCTSLPPVYRIPSNVTKEDKYITTLKFKELQLQYSTGNSSIAKFGFANECEGFFSATIWMGLVCTLVLGLILAFGLCMLANIHSMDRFDDPKGKTITVNVAD